MTKVNQPPIIVAVIVTYQPDLDLLGAQLGSLVRQVTNVVLVDNNSAQDLAIWNVRRNPAATAIISLGENRGIAAAQNAGIEWAGNRGAEFVLLMDQDSIPAPDMVEKLVSAISEKSSPAAVGSRYVDELQNNASPFTQIRGLRLLRSSCTSKEAPVVPVDYLIASGCLIPMSVLNEVGVMREDLFIDYVDIEWCLRARHHGFQSYGVCSAHMRHSLGGDPIKFFGKNIPLHNPLRHYYQFRNAVLLYKEPWIPLNWKVADGWRLCRRYVFYALFAKPRMAYWRLMTLGILHGLAGRTGKFEGRMVRSE